MSFRVRIESDPVPSGDLPNLASGAAESRADGYQLPRMTMLCADSAAAAGRPDVVDLASLESFPASDPPGWIALSVGSPSGSASDGAPREETGGKPGLGPREPDGRAEDACKSVLRSWPARQVGKDRSSIPGTAQGVAVRIYRPGRSATQSGRGIGRRWIMEFEPRWAPEIEPLMGWTSSRDTRQQVKLSFPSKEAAIAFATRQGWPCTVIDSPEPQLRPPLRSERLGLWPRSPLRDRLRCDVSKEPIRQTSQGEKLRGGEVRS